MKIKRAHRQIHQRTPQNPKQRRAERHPFYRKENWHKQNQGYRCLITAFWTCQIVCIHSSFQAVVKIVTKISASSPSRSGVRRARWATSRSPFSENILHTIISWWAPMVIMSPMGFPSAVGAIPKMNSYTSKGTTLSSTLFAGNATTRTVISVWPPDS
jgi:hypothetical protein